MKKSVMIYPETNPIITAPINPLCPRVIKSPPKSPMINPGRSEIAYAIKADNTG